MDPEQGGPVGPPCAISGRLWLAPDPHPWYLQGLLPFEVASGRVAGLVWSALLRFGYAPLDAWSPGAGSGPRGAPVRRGGRGKLTTEVALSGKPFQAPSVFTGR